MNNFVETVTMTRNSYDELKNQNIDLIAKLHEKQQDYENAISKHNKELSEALNEIHELKQYIIQENLCSDLHFRGHKLEQVLNLESTWDIGIINYSTVKKYVSDEEIQIAIEMKWHEVNDPKQKTKEEDNVRF